jgi:purine-binding chemotaxis protein CheW
MKLDFENEDTQKDKYLIFSLGDENYGIPIHYVIEIINIVEITKVPEQPAYVKGIINLRGKVLSVMDVRLRFQKAEKTYDDRTCIIVIQVEGESFGLIVDNVKEVASIDEENISEAPTMNQEDSAIGFIDGVGKMEGEIWLLVDCKKLLKS